MIKDNARRDMWSAHSRVRELDTSLGVGKFNYKSISPVMPHFYLDLMYHANFYVFQNYQYR